MIKVGDEIAQRVFWIDRELLKKYADASGDQNPIHQDEAFAKSVGLPDVIAHGMLTMALAGKFVSDWAGGSSASRRRCGGRCRWGSAKGASKTHLWVEL